MIGRITGRNFNRKRIGKGVRLVPGGGKAT